jgi:hypothetical protein
VGYPQVRRIIVTFHGEWPNLSFVKSDNACLHQSSCYFIPVV